MITLTHKVSWGQARSAGKEGEYTRERGFLAYYEVCQLQQRDGWDMKRDSVGGPFITREDQWVGFDDKEYIIKKV